MNSTSNINIHSHDISNFHLHVLSLNIRSFAKHYDEFLVLLDDLQTTKNITFDIITLTETWITSEQLTLFPLDNYSAYSCSRQDGTKSGGVIVFIRETIPHTAASQHSNAVDVIKLKIKLPHLKNNARLNEVEFISLYRDQRKTTTYFISELENILLNQVSQASVITGDLNIDLLDDNISAPLLNLTSSYGFNSFNFSPTRFGINKHGNRTASCLDHLFARNFDNVQCTVYDAGITDHRALITDVTLPTTLVASSCSTAPTLVTFINRNELLKALQRETWTCLDFSSVDSAFESFITKYNELKCSCTETKEFSIRKPKKKRAPWLTDHSLNLSHLKKQIYKEMQKKKTSDEAYENLKNQFKSISSLLIKSTRKDKIQYYNNRLDSCKTAKQYWNELKSICGMKKSASQQEIKLYDSNNTELITDPNKITHILNSHYANIAEKTLNSNPLFNSSPSINYALNQEKTVLHSFGCHEITIYDLHEAVKSLANKNSVGDDKITASELKQYWEQLGLPLLLIFNYSLTKGTFPEALKKLTITPLPKIPNASKPEDYRPIAILSTLSKLFEIIIQRRMVKFLFKQHFFSENQFGFLPSRNTSEALQSHISHIVNNLENKNMVLGLYLDISKAFDTVNHTILLDKLYKAGFRGSFHSWLKSYLSDRVQCVKYKQVKSSCLPVVSGVPQGSTLGPLLFLIYINSLLLLPLNGPVFSFADDTAFVYSGKSDFEISQKCLNDLEKLNHWFLFHKISPNLQKTLAVRYRYKKPNYTANTILWHLPDCKKDAPCSCTKINIKNHTKYLGLFLNTNLSWGEQSNYLQLKLRKLNYLLYHLKNKVPKSIRLRIYKAFYEPVLQYGIECWGGAADYILHPVKVLQKYSIRATTGSNRLDHALPLFTKMKVLPFAGIYERALASVLHRQAKKGQLPPIVLKHYNTRTPKQYPVPNTWRNKKAKRQVPYKAPTFTSTLPEELLTHIGTPSFLPKLKTFLLNKHCVV